MEYTFEILGGELFFKRANFFHLVNERGLKINTPHDTIN